jgi:Putative metal-binding motif
MLRIHRLLVSAFAIYTSGACGARTDLEVEDPCSATGSEVCDGIDNDCNGRVDDGIEPVQCGTLGCVTTVACEDGFMPTCVPREPSEERCNFIDDDCDGEVDEGFGFGPLAEAVTVRTDEFDTGDCTSCSWAFGTTIAPTTDGFRAIWNIGLSGGSEQPNLFGRRLDPMGNPTGPVELLRPDFFLTLHPMIALEPVPPRGVPIDAMNRVGSGDVPGFLFANTAGEADSVLPTPASGPYNVPRTVWTGARFVSAWEEESQLRVAVLDANGVLEQELDVDPLERPASITLGVYRDRVGILVSRYVAEPETRDQWIILLDALGNVVTPARQIDVEYATWQRLVGTEEGWLHIRPNSFGEPATRQPLDVDGDPLDVATPFADGRQLSDAGGQDIFIPRPEQNEALTVWQSPENGEMHVEFLDSRGNSKRAWSGPLPTVDPNADYLEDPHVAIAADRILVIWHGGAPDSAPNRVMVRAFGCVQ